MARVNVEQKALTDPRFRAVGASVQALEKMDRASVEHSCGLTLCIRVWDQCQERGSDLLPILLVECIAEGLSDALLVSDLAEKHNKTTLRIKGARERCLWLSACRTAGKNGGKLGGRPHKPLGDIGEETPGGSAQKTPPTLTPALSSSPSEKKVSAPHLSAFKPPSIEEVRAYCLERGNAVDPEAWMNHYTANGWMVGRTRMKDWRAAVRTWEKNSIGSSPQKNGKPSLEELNARMAAQYGSGAKAVERD